MTILLRTFLYSLVVLVLAACGGSGSSSSGGGAGSFAGTYTGLANLTISGGGASERVIGSLEFLIRSDGSVVSDPGTDFSGQGSVQGNRLILNLAASSFNEPGLSCMGSFRLEGTISGNTITGTIRGSSITCNRVRFTVTGTFNVRKVAQSRRAWDGQALQAVQSILGQHAVQ